MRTLALVVLLLLASVLGSRGDSGTTLAPSPAVSDSPANQGQTSSPPEPVIAPGPVVLPSAPPAPSVSPAPEKGDVSPPVPPEPQNAPSPATPPKENNAPPPTEVTPPDPPKENNAPPPTEISPPDPTDEVPPPVAPPQAAVENPTPTLPGTPPLVPSVQAPAPSAALKPIPPLVPPPSVNSQPTRPIISTPILPGTPALLPSVQAPAPSAAPKLNPPVVQPPSVSNQPNRPVGSAPPYPLPAFPPPRNDVPPYPPTGSFPAIPPSTSVPHLEPPTSSPVVAKSPQQKAAAPSSEHMDGNNVPPANTSPPANLKNHHVPRASPPKESSGQTVPVHKSPITGSAPATSPLPQNTNMPSAPKNASSVPHTQPPSSSVPPKSAPTSRPHSRGWKSNKPNNGANPSLSPSYPPSHAQGPGVSQTPRQAGAKRQNHHAPPPIPRDHPIFPVHSPSPSPVPPKGQTNGHKRHRISPTIPTIPPEPEPKAPSAHPIWALPPPPPNLDCKSLSCPEPLTDPPTGAPCACVLPIKVAIRLSVDLYSFFPLVSDFAEEVSSGVNMAQRQVRVMGANVANDQPDKTVVLVDLVPMQVKFDHATAFSAFESLWSKKLPLKPSIFGDYEILYVVYPGLPPSPPSAPEAVGDGALGKNRNARAMKPLGVDIRKPQKKVNGSLVAIVVLSTIIALSVCCLAAWLLILGFRGSNDMAQRFPRSVLPKFSRSSGTGHTHIAGRSSSPSGPSGSLGSSMATYTGQAKTFKFAEIDKATNSFDDSKVLGEGGFGCVYQGTLEDGTRVAVKVLKRFDGQGEREFLAEVEMLGRLHHRNLVKLLGICVEENARCLVYELIPNGSVESHLHAVDPLLGPSVPLDNVAKAAAIAQMCVQPEVAHRPSMGEVVQALKLVCSEGDDGIGSGRFSQELPVQTTAVYDATGMEAERVLLSEIYGSTPVFTPAAEAGSFRKQSSSGPLMTGKNMKFWQRLRSMSRGSMSEHGFSPDYETRSQYSGR
ncbi:hypothetical protein EJB05_31018 [Eragrostis curvula]|uniref:Protein kinase domain-containing protein n=1 Tax=Eragrostis curvula TaxID=38414 RepID=A0A5J9UE52_9POAL|nr:hypothetical protein EJB05_31018 [Eragrostis curvula]